jgi:hypothetical protein
VIVRFRPRHDVRSKGVGDELSALQRELLQILAVARSSTLANVRATLQVSAADRTMNKHLALLRD